MGNDTCDTTANRGSALGPRDRIQAASLMDYALKYFDKIK